MFINIMEITLDIGFNQLLGIIRKLPYEQKIQLLKEVENETIHKQTDNFSEFLLNGPIMTKEEEENFERFNEEFDKWTKNLFV